MRSENIATFFNPQNPLPRQLNSAYCNETNLVLLKELREKLDDNQFKRIGNMLFLFTSDLEKKADRANIPNEIANLLAKFKLAFAGDNSTSILSQKPLKSNALLEAASDAQHEEVLHAVLAYPNCNNEAEASKLACEKLLRLNLIAMANSAPNNKYLIEQIFEFPSEYHSAKLRLIPELKIELLEKIALGTNNEELLIAAVNNKNCTAKLLLQIALKTDNGKLLDAIITSGKCSQEVAFQIALRTEIGVALITKAVKILSYQATINKEGEKILNELFDDLQKKQPYYDRDMKLSVLQGQACGEFAAKKVLAQLTEETQGKRISPDVLESILENAESGRVILAVLKDEDYRSEELMIFSVRKTPKKSTQWINPISILNCVIDIAKTENVFMAVLQHGGPEAFPNWAERKLTEAARTNVPDTILAVIAERTSDDKVFCLILGHPNFTDTVKKAMVKNKLTPNYALKEIAENTLDKDVLSSILQHQNCNPKIRSIVSARQETHGDSPTMRP